MRFPVVFPFPCGPTVYSPVDHSGTFHRAIRKFMRESSIKVFRLKGQGPIVRCVLGLTTK